MLAAGFATLCASALQPQTRPITTPLDSKFDAGRLMPQTTALAKAPNMAAGTTGSLKYSPAEAPYQAVSLKNQQIGMQLAQAFYMTPDVVKKFAGNEIKNIYFYTGYNNSASTQTTAVNTIKKATLFLAYDLQDFNPFYTQTVDLPAEGLTLQSVVLDTPYEIAADKPLYVGLYYHLSATDDVTFTVDFINHGDDVSGGWIGVRAPATSSDPNPEWTFDNIAQQVGFLCLGVVIEGSNLPTNEVSTPLAEVQPTVYQDEEFTLLFMVRNDAANDVTSFECEITVGDDAPLTVTFTMDTPISYGKTGVAAAQGLTYGTPSLATVPVTATVKKVNGEPNNSATSTVSAEIQVIPAGKGFQRNVIVEEFTGTWCGYCPQGIVTMEKLREKYTDGSVIPVAVHYSDPMSSPSFSTVQSTYADGYPSAIMNRQMYINYIYPTEDCFEEIETYMSYPAPATISLAAGFNENKTGIIFDTKTSFSFDNENAADDYILAFAVTEDNVGPYTQQSNFSGSTLPGWGNKPNAVETIYNDVARQYNTNNGIAGSIPASVEYGKEYEFSYEMKFLAASKINNVLNLNAIAYLINRHTGVVENASMVKAGSLAAISDVTADNGADADAPVEYYNLQGIRVAQPACGIYIKRQGSTARVVTID